MTDFANNELIVATECEHVFHKRCCQEWLKQARTCPVCRTDIPDSLGVVEEEGERDPSVTGLAHDGILFSRGPFRQDVLNLVTLLREANNNRR